jgi:hypothetical protein
LIQSNQKLRALLALAATIAAVHAVHDRLVLLTVLLACWWIIFRPIGTAELVMFGVAAVFFLFQNYVTLKAGLFEFRFKDILLMPYYEPFLWGFYYLGLKRFVDGVGRRPPDLSWKAVGGLVTTSATFSVFSFDSDALLMATICSTAVLLALFHERGDLAYAISGLVLGLIVELYGVSAGLWWYPQSDLLGIPYWFATMWVSAGLLGRRFLMPLSELATRRFTQGA